MTCGIAQPPGRWFILPVSFLASTPAAMFRMKEILTLLCLSIPAVAASLPDDRETVARAELSAPVAAPTESPPTPSFSQRVEYIDFSSYGKDSTQVVVTPPPDKPRLHRGKKLVVVGGEP